MKRYYQRSLPILLAAMLAAPLSTAQVVKKPETWQVSFKDSDIQEVIKFVADVTGKTVVIDPRVKGRVKVISAEPLTSEALYSLFLSVLEIQGFTAVEVGDIVRIIPRKDARTSAVPVQSTKSLGSDAYVTEVIQLKNVSASKVLPVLRPLAPQHAHLAAYEPSNAIIVSDTVGNIARLKEVISRIDRAAVSETDVVSLRHAQAGDVVQMLQQLQKTGGAKDAPSSSSTTFVADIRSNSVLISGDAVQREKARGLVQRLDVDQPQTGNVRVIYLEYADAEQVAGVLGKLVANMSKLSGEGKGKSTSGGVATVEADPDTNALLITADGAMLESLMSVVKRLDIRRAQVLIEAIIVEIEDVAGRSLGVQWITQDESGAFASSVNNSGSLSSAGAGFIGRETTTTSTIDGVTTTSTDREPAEFTDLVGSLAGVIGQTIGVGKIDSGTNFVALINALKQNTGSNILSTPNLLTTDNREASISVGQNVPIITGSSTTSTGDATNPFQTIERKDVGISLTVTPQINEGNSVVLDIEQEVSSLTGSTGASDIITNERKISTQVIASDGEIIVLGGLMRDDVQQSQAKVPLLGDIPILGRLFRNDSATASKTNLMVFLRATIVRDKETLRGATAEKYRHIRDEQLKRRDKGVLMLDDEVLPLLPIWEEAIRPSTTLVPASVDPEKVRERFPDADIDTNTDASTDANTDS